MDADFFDNMVKFMMNGESVVLLLTTTTETDNPIQKWKSFIGLPDPVEAKVYFLNKQTITSPFRKQIQIV